MSFSAQAVPHSASSNRSSAVLTLTVRRLRPTTLAGISTSDSFVAHLGAL